MKKKIIYTILILVMLIPSFVAVSSYFSAKRAPADSKNVISVSIKDSQQNVYELDRSRDGEAAEELIDLIMEIKDNATEVSAIPTSVAGSTPFLITLSTPVKSNSYQFYFDEISATVTSNCYYTFEGKSYHIKPEDAGKFLSTEYAECLYLGANVPTLTVSDESVVKPSSLAWEYKNYKLELVEKKDTEAYIETGEQHVDVIGAVSLKFSIEPDIYTVLITDEEGNVQYESTGETHTPVSFKEETKVNVAVKANWFENENTNCAGETTYNFTATVSAPPSFHLAADTVYGGKFVVLTAVDAKDASKISFSSEPELGTSPVFYTSGGDSYGILPIPLDSSGNYKLTLSYGGAATQLDLKVSPFADCLGTWYSPDVARGMPYSPDVFASAYSDEARAEFAALVKELCESDEAISTAQTKYFSGYFLGPNEEYGRYGSSTNNVYYGQKIAITGNENDSMTFVSEGIDQVYSGDVPAANAGRVVYVGSTAYSGHLVVIEHGWGLKTWYWNLGETSVTVGASVNRGDVVGKTGTTGFNTGSEGVHLAMSVGSSFVCPYDTWSDADGDFKDGVLIYTE